MKRIRNYSLYIAMLIPMAVLVYLFAGTFFKANDDMVTQHLPYMLHVGQWARESFSALLHHQPIATYDFSLGLGGDIIQMLNYYGLGDPLVLLIGFFDKLSPVQSYGILVAVRVILAGMAFLALCRHYGYDGTNTAVGAVCYALSMFMVQLAVFRHPFFGNPMIQLPLLLIGTDRVLEKRAPWLLIVTTAWTALCGYYFLYMCTVFVVLYAFIRHFGNAAHPFKSFFGAFLRTAVCYIIGLCLAMPLLLPATLGFLGGQRTADLGNLSLMTGMSLTYYLQLPRSFISSGGWSIGIPILLLWSMLAGLFRKDGHRGQRIAMTLVLAIFLLWPAVGVALNGFAYLTDRWTFALTLLILVIGAANLPELLTAKRGCDRVLTAMTILGCVYCVAMSVLYAYGSRGQGILRMLEEPCYFLCGAFFLVISRIAIGIAQKKTNRVGAVILTSVIIVNLLAVNCVGLLKGRINDAYVSGDEIIELYETSPMNQASRMRIDATENDAHFRNDGTLHGVSSTLIYNSTLPASYVRFTADMELPAYNRNFAGGLDGRTGLRALWAIDGTIEDGKAVAVDDTLPFGYTTNRYILQSEYDVLPAWDKEAALLQAAAIPAEDGTLTHVEYESDAILPDVSIEYDGVTYTDGLLKATAGGTMTYAFENAEDCEVLIRISELNVLSAGDSYPTICIGGKRIVLPYANANQKTVQTNFLYNCGVVKADTNQVTMTFDHAVTAQIEDVQIILRPMDGVLADIEAMGDCPMTDVVFEANAVTGKCTVSEDRLLILPVIRADGWSATVDGEATELIASGTAWTALKLSKGDHIIRLTYTTPGLKIGWLLFALGLVGCAVLMVLRVKDRLYRRT